MIKMTLFNPHTTPIHAVLAPYVLPPGRAYQTQGKGEIGLTFHSRDDAEAFRRRMNEALDRASTED